MSNREVKWATCFFSCQGQGCPRSGVEVVEKVFFISIAKERIQTLTVKREKIKKEGMAIWTSKEIELGYTNQYNIIHFVNIKKNERFDLYNRLKGIICFRNL